MSKISRDTKVERCLWLAALLSVGAVALPTVANPFEKQLANGLRVIVKEDRRAPTAVHMVWYRAGAMDEKDGTSGVAHVLEHMMFKGTKKLKPGEFNKTSPRPAAATMPSPASTTPPISRSCRRPPCRR